jgi:hypothetical protein
MTVHRPPAVEPRPGSIAHLNVEAELQGLRSYLVDVARDIDDVWRDTEPAQGGVALRLVQASHAVRKAIAAPERDTIG